MNVFRMEHGSQDTLFMTHGQFNSTAFTQVITGRGVLKKCLPHLGVFEIRVAHIAIDVAIFIITGKQILIYSSNCFFGSLQHITVMFNVDDGSIFLSKAWNVVFCLLHANVCVKCKNFNADTTVKKTIRINDQTNSGY